MQRNPEYGDVVEDILGFFRESLRNALRAGIERDKMILDPGIGFGKSPEHNLEILRRLDEFRCLGRPLAIGTSRKNVDAQEIVTGQPRPSPPRSSAVPMWFASTTCAKCPMWPV